MTVNNNLPVSVTIASNAAGNTICSGTSVTFTATPTNGGSSPSYQWYNGVTAITGETGSTYTTSTLVNGDQIHVVLTSNITPCATGNPATSNTITTTVIAVQTPTVSIASDDADNSICAGTTVAFTATANNTAGGTVTYNFKVNGTSVQNSASNVYSTSTLANNDAVTCQISITGGTCLTTSTVTSSSIVTTVIAVQTPTVSIAVNPGSTICSGTSVTFTATANNTAGGAVNYNFKVNGTSVQNGTSNVFSISTLANNDAVTCEISITGGTCLTTSTAASNTINMTVNAIPSAPSLAAGEGGQTTFCSGQGSSVLFADQFTGIQWYKNSSVLSGATDFSYTATTGGSYTATYTDANGCTSAQSTAIVVTENPLPALSSSLTGSVTTGVQFDYSPTSATTGTTFSWSRAAVTGVSNASATGTGGISEILNLDNPTGSAVNVTYIYTLLSPAGCTNTQNLVVSVNPQTQQRIIAPVAQTQTSDTVAALSVTAMPNPTTDYFNLIIKGTGTSTSTVRVFDKMGTLVEAYQQVAAGKVLRLGSTWAGGIYLVEVVQGNDRKVIKIIKAN
jgi:hypothetical protein